MEPRNMVLMKLFAGQQWRHMHREQTYAHGAGRGERGRDVWRELRKTYTTICKTNSQWEFAV